MNELENYRNKQAEDCFAALDNLEIGKSGFKEGFNAAIALNLPIKFAEWKDENFYKNDNKDYYPQISSKHFNIMKLKEFQKQDAIKLEQLYQYWLNNIYKIE